MSNRRDFVATTGALLGAAFLPPSLLRSRSGARKGGRGAPADGAVVLLQVDSSTDCGRNRKDANANAAPALGTGYPLLVSSEVLDAHPDAGLRFFNRGVSGDKVPDLAKRWDADTIALQPDILSILIGVNDYWARTKHGYTGTPRDYEDGYDALLARTRQALPKVRLVVMEPFVLRFGAVDASWFPEFDERRAIAARVAQRAGATFVPLQATFDDLVRQAPPEYWLIDGVHPTPAGHAAIAEQWRRAVGL